MKNHSTQAELAARYRELVDLAWDAEVTFLMLSYFYASKACEDAAIKDYADELKQSLLRRTDLLDQFPVVPASNLEPTEGEDGSMKNPFAAGGSLAKP